MPKKNFFLLVLVSLCVSSQSFADIRLGGRHIYMVQSGVDMVFGSYMFGVTNEGTEPKRFRVPVILPKETVDFRPQEGIQLDELKVEPDGKLFVEKVFAPGINILGVGFMSKIEGGEGTMTIPFTFPVEEFSIMTRDSELSITSSELEIGSLPMFKDSPMRSLINKKPLSGQPLKVIIKGIPVGRGGFRSTGYIFAIILVLFAAVLSYFTYPEKDDSLPEET